MSVLFVDVRLGFMDGYYADRGEQWQKEMVQMLNEKSPGSRFVVTQVSDSVKIPLSEFVFAPDRKLLAESSENVRLCVEGFVSRMEPSSGKSPVERFQAVDTAVQAAIEAVAHVTAPVFDEDQMETACHLNTQLYGAFMRIISEMARPDDGEMPWNLNRSAD